MFEIDIPGFDQLHIEHVVMDYNGTLALDGHIQLGIPEDLRCLAKSFKLHVITADTNHRAAEQLAGLPVTLRIIPAEAQAETKLEYIRNLGEDRVIAIGNGRNDRLMLKAAALGIAVLQKEGTAAAAIQNADLLSPSIGDALDLLKHPRRLISTLRS
ncbi:HAD family hydrolase [Luteolibacter luteus]|uniref:HAD hydrolase family protein n=1 Tax=Luteolibacter luteus TaxID=2728835 RepID=A0A858REK2_9BACT|nr:HAD hydrolase family protein [Luteolibacter luteus]QJE94593.1 HAD hydrolase family protein [Luteolibacter luteus]